MTYAYNIGSEQPDTQISVAKGQAIAGNAIGNLSIGFTLSSVSTWKGGVISVLNATGRYDLFVELFLESQKELMEFLVNEISRVDGIQATETFVYLDGINKWVNLI